MTAVDFPTLVTGRHVVSTIYDRNLCPALTVLAIWANLKTTSVQETKIRSDILMDSQGTGELSKPRFDGDDVVSVHLTFDKTCWTIGTLVFKRDISHGC